MCWWNCSPNILGGQGCLGGNAIGGEVLLNGGAKESSIDEEFKRDRLGRLEKSIHERGERIAAEVYRFGVEMISGGFKHENQNQIILVFTKIGPVCSGNDRSVSRVVSCNLTCVDPETLVFRAMIAMEIRKFNPLISL